jgi:hypothetical protein
VVGVDHNADVDLSALPQRSCGARAVRGASSAMTNSNWDTQVPAPFVSLTVKAIEAPREGYEGSGVDVLVRVAALQTQQVEW